MAGHQTFRKGKKRISLRIYDKVRGLRIWRRCVPYTAKQALKAKIKPPESKTPLKTTDDPTDNPDASAGRLKAFSSMRIK